MEAPIVKDGGFIKDGGSNFQRWRLQLSKMEASSKMEAPIVKDGGSNYHRWRLQIWRLQIVNNLATNPPFFLPC